MIGIFDDFGIRFEYPLDWDLEVGDDGEGRRTVGVQSPDGLAFAFVQIDEERPDPGALADEALSAMRAEYPTLDSIPAAEKIDGRDAVGHDVDFFSLDVPNVCAIRAFRSPNRTVLVFAQWSELLDEHAGDMFRVLCRSLEETDS